METLKSQRRNKIIVPATLCLSPAVVARLCGLDVVFCDVQQSSGNLCPVELDRLLASEKDIGAVLAAHLYGQPADICEIAAICRRHSLPLIEDLAQALGAETESGPVGAFGDLAIMSFGHTKILDAGDGGAILTDDDPLAADLRARRDRLPVRPPQTAAWSADYRKTYYAIASLEKSQPRLRRLLGELGQLFPEMYRYRLDEGVVVRIDAMLDGLDEEIAHRRSLADHYRSLLDGLPIAFLKTEAKGAPWRFSFMMDASQRDHLLMELRAGGFHVSSWYPALPPFFAAAYNWQERWPAAAAIERKIVNFWVDRATSHARASACCVAIAEKLNRKASVNSP